MSRIITINIQYGHNEMFIFFRKWPLFIFHFSSTFLTIVLSSLWGNRNHKLILKTLNLQNQHESLRCGKYFGINHMIKMWNIVLGKSDENYTVECEV